MAMKSNHAWLYCMENEDWDLPLSFNKKRHIEKIQEPEDIGEYQSWRMKERMKTVSVALVVCLNVGVDPPDVVKTQPCARYECWIDPLSLSAPKALENIGNNLQRQYERWQPKARYKQVLDPTIDEVKKLCISLRRSAKEERVLFHYNGHGVPRPTINGELWVFNKTFTQYIPLSIYDLQSWMGAPSIYVYDCSNAGIIINLFKQIAEQREKDYQKIMSTSTRNSVSAVNFPSFKNCIHLAACSPDQLLPMNPELPADMFTSCLTTPIKIALRWFIMQKTSKLVPRITIDLIDKIPGQLNDRRTMLGELNWIFTAVTDAIAWNVLSKDMFQKLFRQDLLVASLFRNFLLAERVMRSYSCIPMSSPKLPPTYQNTIWQAWDLALDRSLCQLPGIIQDDEPYVPSPFFEEYLTAFEVWLKVESHKKRLPEHLPIILQVLLSHMYRLRALKLLSKFLDLGPWAVNLALCVGIFPYILKLLQTSSRELRGILISIWAKIIAIDATVQSDLIRENSYYRYFVQVLQDPSAEDDHKTMSAFIMSCVVHNYSPGKEVALQCNLLPTCLELLGDPNVHLRKWLIICIARLWMRYDKARWCGVRDLAHEKLFTYLKDDCPEIRAATVFALGTFMNMVGKRSEHANNIDQSVAIMLMNVASQDMSPLVRQELIVALQWLVIAFENVFSNIATQDTKEVKDSLLNADAFVPTILGTMRRNLSRDRIKVTPPASVAVQMAHTEMVTVGIDCVISPENILLDSEKRQERMHRVSSSNSINSIGYGSNSSSNSSSSYGAFHMKLWQTLTSLESDPYPLVSRMAYTVTTYIRDQTKETIYGRELWEFTRSDFSSLPPSPSNRISCLGESPTTKGTGSYTSSSTTTNQNQNVNNVAGTMPSIVIRVEHRPRSISQIGGRVAPIEEKDSLNEEENTGNNNYKQLVCTEFCEWCTKYFYDAAYHSSEYDDTESQLYLEREWRYNRNMTIRLESLDEYCRASQLRLENQIYSTKCSHPPSILLFHPYEPHLYTASKDSVTVLDYQAGVKLCNVSPERSNNNGRSSVNRISALELVNAHDSAMLMVATEDGCVKLWSNYLSSHTFSSSQEPKLVTAWQALPELSTMYRNYSGAGNGGVTGMCMCWDQRSQHLLVAGGDVRFIKVWDAQTELKILDLPTGTDSSVNCLSLNHNGGDIFAIGCTDGSVRIFDQRLPPLIARTITYREHTGCIISAKIRQTKPETLIAGCVFGEIRTFDIRSKLSVFTCRTANNVTALAAHPLAEIFACATANQVISLYNTEGNLLNTSKSHDWFMSPRMSAPVSSLSFHPNRVLLAYAIDSSISVCSLDTK